MTNDDATPDSLPIDDEDDDLKRLRVSHVKGRAKALGLEVVRKRGLRCYWLLHNGSELVPYAPPSLLHLDNLEAKLTQLESQASQLSQ